MKINIKHVAKLANIPLKSDEEEKLEKQLNATLEHVERLEKIDTEGVPPTDHVIGLVNITREDETTPSLSQKQALQGGKNIYNGFFKVKAVLEN